MMKAFHARMCDWGRAVRVAALSGMMLTAAGCGDARDEPPDAAALPAQLDAALDSDDRSTVREELLKLIKDEQAPADAPLLHLAVYAARDAVVQRLLADGEKVDEADDERRTALIVASQRGRAGAAAALLDAGAAVNAADKHGLTALHYAVTGNHADTVRLLLAHQAKVNAADRTGRAPMHDGGKADAAVRKLLLDAGADVNLGDVRGSTPLHRAAATDDIAFTAWLLEHGADASVKNIDGFTPRDIARDKAGQVLDEHAAKQ